MFVPSDQAINLPFPTLHSTVPQVMQGGAQKDVIRWRENEQR